MTAASADKESDNYETTTIQHEEFHNKMQDSSSSLLVAPEDFTTGGVVPATGAVEISFSRKCSKCMSYEMKSTFPKIDVQSEFRRGQKPTFAKLPVVCGTIFKCDQR